MREAADKTVTSGEMFAVGWGSGRVFGVDGAAGGEDLFGEFAVARGINLIDSTTEESDGASGVA